MKNVLIVVLALSSSKLLAQTIANNANSIVSVSYTGGFFTHPGFSLEYHWNTSLNRQWSIRPGVKLGTYFHKRYQSAVFILPEIQLIRSEKRGWMLGVSLHAGMQRHLIPNTYVWQETGELTKKKNAGTNHFVFAPGVVLGRKIGRNTAHPIELFFHPQLQFRLLHRNSNEYKMERYVLGSIGVNYSLQKK